MLVSASSFKSAQIVKVDGQYKCICSILICRHGSRTGKLEFPAYPDDLGEVTLFENTAVGRQYLTEDLAYTVYRPTEEIIVFRDMETNTFSAVFRRKNLSSTYIMSNNIGAKESLIKLGYSLIRGYKDYYINNDPEEGIFAIADVWYVDWEGSGSSFNKFLRKKGLLMKDNGWRK